MRYNIFSYFVGEGCKNVFKTKKATSAILIMLTTMFIFGFFFAITKNVNHVMYQIETKQGMQAYLKEGTTQEDIKALESRIKALDGVNTVTFVSKEDALNKMKEKLKDKQSLLAGYEENNPFPASFVITLSKLENSSAVQEAIKQDKNIESITTRDDTINTLINIAKGAKLLSFIIIVLLVFVAIFIIGNTIKLTVDARRKEISIMKYVGATDKFIKAPFVVEGIIIGLISAALSILICGLLYNVFCAKLVNSQVLKVINIELLSFKDMFSAMLIVFLCLGIGIGTIGSTNSMRKYLDV